MARVYDEISPEIAEFIAAQHMFFVATAPSGDGGHVNLSPKGLDTLAVLDPNTVAYLDLTGSGVETIAHLRDNGRITIMFCAFDRKPLIVRLYGRGEVLPIGEPGGDALLWRFDSYPGARSVIRVRLDRVSTSCGYGVPLLQFEGERDQLHKFAERRGPDGLVEYRAENNAASIDGLPGLGAGGR
jgi:hypothetical protein